MVEMALVLPILIILLLGIVTGGAAYNHKLAVVHAAREGARFGAVLPSTQCTPTSSCDNRTWAQLVRDVVVERSEGGLTAGNVCVALVSGSTGVVIGGAAKSSFTTKGDLTSCFDDGNGDAGSRVQVSVTTGDEIDAAFFSIPVTLSSKATARFEQ